MRVLHLGWGYPPTYLFGGPVYYVHRLALTQIAAGHEVTVACASDLDQPDLPPWALGTAEYEGVRYLHLLNRPAQMYRLDAPREETLDIGCERAFLALLDSERPDVVHIHNLVGLCLTLPRLARQRGVPVVMSLHNYWPLCPRVDLFQADDRACPGPQAADCGACLGVPLSPEPYRARHAAAIAALSSCDRLIAVSRRVAEIYVEHGVPSDLVEVERIGSEAADRLWRGMGRERVGDPSPEGVRFAFFGSRVPNKGPHVILEALGRMRNADGYRFAFLGAAGGPAFMQRLDGLLAALGPRAANVTTRGHYTQDELPGLLADADVAVLTPQWEDNGPQTVFEALGAGLPVVGTTMGGLTDVVRDGVNGLLVPPGDPAALAAALDRLVDDPSLVARLRAGLVPPRTMAEHERELARIYAAAAGAARPAPRVSVLLRVGDERDRVIGCLTALAESTPEDAFELVVVDEASRDGTRELLAAVSGDVRVITRDRPGSRTAALRDAAAAGRAPRVVALTAGARMRAGWLDRAFLAGPEPTPVDEDGRTGGAAVAVVAPRATAEDEAGATAVARLLARR